MDSNSVYIKTAAGEEAIQHRVRVIQRNVRMVLILVDGRSTVADLSRKIGNSRLTENALAELEDGGFVELEIEQHDSDQGSVKKTHSAVPNRTGKEPSATANRAMAPNGKRADNGDGSLDSSSHTIFDDSSANTLQFGAPVFNVPDNGGFLSSHFFISKEQAQEAPADRETGNIREAAPLDSSDRDAEETPPAAKQFSAMAHLKLLWPSTVDHEHDERNFMQYDPHSSRSVHQRSGRRRSGHRMGWPGVVLSGLLVLIVSACLAVILFPYDRFVPEVESAFSRAVSVPVKLGALQVDIRPVAGLTLKNVRMGEGKDEIRVGTIQLQPELATMFSQEKIFRRVVLNDMVLPLEKISVLSKLFNTLTAPGNNLSAHRIELRDIGISFMGIELKGLRTDLGISPGKRIQSFDMRSSSENLHVIVKPMDQRTDLVLEAYAWNPLQSPVLLIDFATLNGRLENGILAIDISELRFAGGLVQGVAAIQNGTKPNITGDIAFERMNTTRLGEALGLGKKFTGDAAGKMSFQSTADSWSSILPSIHANGTFSILQRGSITGIDLAEAARRSPGTPAYGGTTSFEQLTGKMRLSPERNQFSELSMGSGLIQSSGYVDVIPGGKLNGKLEMLIKRNLDQTRIPISLAGTLESPSAQATRY